MLKEFSLGDARPLGQEHITSDFALKGPNKNAQGRAVWPSTGDPRFRPERAQQESPGQRPGLPTSPCIFALKGHDKPVQSAVNSRLLPNIPLININLMATKQNSEFILKCDSPMV